MKKLSFIFIIIALLFFIACPTSPDGGDGGDSGDAGDSGDGGVDEDISVFVSVDGDDIDGDGTISAPYATIQKGIDIASASDVDDLTDVVVSAGTYNESIVMFNSIKVKGGYDPIEWTRDISVNETIIQDPATTGGTSTSPNRAVYFPPTITDSPTIDGFKIIGGSGEYTNGIFIEEAVGTISNNTINGGDGNYSTGIANSSGIVVIDSNEINGGSGNSTNAIFNTGDGANPTIQNNVILGGGNGANNSYGVNIWDDSMATIYNNTIDGGLANTARCISLKFGGSTITNNILFTSGTGSSRYGIYELPGDTEPSELKNNDIFDCPTALYYDYDASPRDLTDIADVNAMTDITGGVSGNVSVDPVFVGSGDFHLSSSSPVSVTEGGLDLSVEGLTEDKDGNPRTNPYSIGAYEYDDTGSN
jgi:hypothetical protein